MVINVYYFSKSLSCFNLCLRSYFVADLANLQEQIIQLSMSMRTALITGKQL